jgi:hypothetical protein
LFALTIHLLGLSPTEPSAGKNTLWFPLKIRIQMKFVVIEVRQLEKGEGREIRIDGS